MQDDVLRQLEARVHQLMDASARLRKENQALQDRESALLKEREELLRKNELARTKVESIINKLKNIEQG